MKVIFVTKFTGETVEINEPPFYGKQYMRFSSEVWWELQKDSESEQFVLLKQCKQVEEAYQEFKTDKCI